MFFHRVRDFDLSYPDLLFIKTHPPLKNFYICMFF